jgi:hypothetical protein
MRTILLAKVCPLLAWALLTASPVPAQGQVEVKVVKYPGLANAIKDGKGKVVIMDIWADW